MHVLWRDIYSTFVTWQVLLRHSAFCMRVFLSSVDPVPRSVLFLSSFNWCFDGFCCFCILICVCVFFVFFFFFICLHYLCFPEQLPRYVGRYACLGRTTSCIMIMIMTLLFFLHSVKHFNYNMAFYPLNQNWTCTKVHARSKKVICTCIWPNILSVCLVARKKLRAFKSFK